MRNECIKCLNHDCFDCPLVIEQTEIIFGSNETNFNENEICPICYAGNDLYGNCQCDI